MQSYYAATLAAAPDFKKTINVSESGVEGLDITTPRFQFSEVHFWSDDDFTFAYQQTLMKLTGTVNNSAFRGFEEGEVLFMGAVGNYASTGLWEIRYNFAVRPNRTNVVIDGLSSNVEAEGWEYLWVLYGDNEDSTTHFTVKEPKAAYVEKIYEKKNFGLLQIGTDQLKGI